MSARTVDDAISEVERLLEETFQNLNPENERDGWFMVRITKMREALADRPVGRLESLRAAGLTPEQAALDSASANYSATKLK